MGRVRACGHHDSIQHLEDESGSDSEDDEDDSGEDSDESEEALEPTPAPRSKGKASASQGSQGCSQVVTCRYCRLNKPSKECTRQGSSESAAWICKLCRNSEDTLKKIAKVRGEKVWTACVLATHRFQLTTSGNDILFFKVCNVF